MIVSIRKAAARAALILAMLVGGLVVGGLTPAYPHDDVAAGSAQP